MTSIQIHASEPYEVRIDSGLLHSAADHIGTAFENTSKLCIVTDDIVDALCGNPLESSLRAAGYETAKFVFPHGEASKNLATAQALLEFLADRQFTRTDALIALGGGVVGDLTGFVAAIYLRGIPFAQMPTTLLAAVDSSVGGKTGVNLSAGKNLTGAFWQPRLVLFDTDTFKTLPEAHRLDGIAEALKTALIADADFFHFLVQNPNLENPDDLIRLVARSVEIKKSIVEQDERDKGVRQLLNLGHTVGHAIEACSDFSISHGRGVAMGMAITAKAAAAQGWTDAGCAKAIIDGLKAFHFTLECPYSLQELMQAALKDKKRARDKITLAVPETIGHCRLQTIKISQLKDFIEKGL